MLQFIECPAAARQLGHGGVALLKGTAAGHQQRFQGRRFAAHGLVHGAGFGGDRVALDVIEQAVERCRHLAELVQDARQAIGRGVTRDFQLPAPHRDHCGDHGVSPCAPGRQRNGRARGAGRVGALCFGFSRWCRVCAFRADCTRAGCSTSAQSQGGAGQHKGRAQQGGGSARPGHGCAHGSQAPTEHAAGGGLERNRRAGGRACRHVFMSGPSPCGAKTTRWGDIGNGTGC